MKNYLVTGGAGFIGSHIVEVLLERGQKVRVLDNFSTGKRENISPFLSAIEVVEGDIQNLDICRKAMEGIDFVLHQAALASVPRSVDDPLASNEANVTGTLNLLVAARDAGVRRFVYAASSSAYGDQAAEVKTEDLTPDPLSPYAVAKLASERYVRAFHVCYGMETVSLRYFNVFGPRQDPKSQYAAVIPLFITAILKGESPTIFGDGTQSRDFTYVTNNVEANLLAATADFPADGRVLNIACGKAYSLLDLIAAISEIVGKKAEPEFAPPRAGDVMHSLADISLAKASIGYSPEIDFEEGLRRAVEWYMK